MIIIECVLSLRWTPCPTNVTLTSEIQADTDRRMDVTKDFVVTPSPMLCSEGYAYSLTRIPHLQVMDDRQINDLVNISALAIKDDLVGIQFKIIQ